VTIEPELSLDQPRQINPLAPDGVLAKDSPRPESFSDLVTPRRLGRGRGTPTIRAGGTFTYKSHSTFSRHTRKMWL